MFCYFQSGVEGPFDVTQHPKERVGGSYGSLHGKKVGNLTQFKTLSFAMGISR